MFGLIGLPWLNQGNIPTSADLLEQSESTFWGAPTLLNDSANSNVPNYPIGGAESAQALQEASDALAFLNAIGQTQLATGGSGRIRGWTAPWAA